MSDEFRPVQLGELAYFEMGQSPSSTYVSEGEVGLPFLQGNAEFGAFFPTSQSYCSRPKKICEPGDILISVRAPVGDLNKADQAYVIGRGLAAIRFTEIPAEFGWHLLNYWARDLDRVAQGTTFKAVSKSDLNALQVVLPPPLEQHRIAEILDAADEAIRQSERVIAKLREVKQGLLHDLLTGGLDAEGNLRDPEAHPEQFKDSPLGRIPREWEVRDLGDVAYFEMGQSPSSTFVSEDDVGLPFLQGNAEFGQVYPSADSFCRQPKKLCQPGDILISVRAPVGDLNKADQVYVIGRGLAAVRFTDVFAELGWHLLNQRAGALDRVSQGTTFRAISKGDLAALNVVLPPAIEQRRIATVLDAHDARIRAEEAALDKLRQVKRGLMDDLLTGRVRV
ncbi:MAG: restriction endonuclease subunit S [Chloroflexota bacterium]|nr:restriction endonuclease subunit S [Chloroflexota bacterium]